MEGENRYIGDRTHPRGGRFTRLQTGEGGGEQSRGRGRDQCLLFTDRNDSLSPNRESKGGVLSPWNRVGARAALSIIAPLPLNFVLTDSN